MGFIDFIMGLLPRNGCERGLVPWQPIHPVLLSGSGMSAVAQSEPMPLYV